jgi:flagellar hook-associated protein 2
MAGISGLGSGIKIDEIVPALVAAERAPKQNQLNSLLTSTESKISALGTLYSAVNDLGSALQNLNKASAFQKQSVTSSNSSVLTVTSNGNTPPSKFSLQVQQLASSSKVVLPSVTGGSAATFNTGSLSISAGDNSIDIEITDKNNSLLGIRDAINTAGSGKGISASIVTDSSGARLVLSSSATGAGNDLKVAVTEDGVTAGSNSLKALGFVAGSSVAQLPTLSEGPAATFKQGSLSIVSGAVSLGIDVEAEDTLDTIMQKINADGASQGISASIEIVNGGARLLVHSSAGEDLAVSASGNESSSGTNSLSTLASVPGSNSKTIDTAKSALFKVDGLSVEKKTNTIDDVIDGITIKLTGVQSTDDIAANKTVDITIGQDKSTVRTNLQQFVDSYNKLISTTASLTVVVPSAQEGENPVTGALVGDSTVRGLLASLRKEMVSLNTSGQGVSSLAELGITTQKDGTLSLDSSKLDAYLVNNYDQVSEYLTGTNGFMGRLEAVTKPYLGTEGVIKQRDSALWSTKDSIKTQQAALDLRMEKLQTRLFAQYNAMDSLVGQLSRTSESLASQLASLPGFVKKDS